MNGEQVHVNAQDTTAAKPRNGDFPSTTVALLGTGRIGEPMARQLLKSGYKMRVWHRTRERTVLALLLEEEPTDHARLAHHAIQARSPELIVQYAPTAAHEAVARAARKEAIELFAAALDHNQLLQPMEEAELRKSLAFELRLVDRFEEALSELNTAIGLYRSLQATEQLADALGLKQGVLWGLRRIAEGWEALDEAIRILRPLGPSEALARP